MRQLLVRRLPWFLLVLAIGIVEVFRIIPLLLRRLGMLGLLMLAITIVTWCAGWLSPVVPVAAAIVGYLESTVTLRQIGRVATCGAREGSWWWIKHWVWRRLLR